MADSYTVKIGDYLVIWINGSVTRYIAEVINENPLRLKVEETGPFANLKDADFIILKNESSLIQNDKGSEELLRKAKKLGNPLVSGLKRLGITDGKLHQILPAD